MILGLVGGVGSGKSTVTKVLQSEYGFELLLTDDIAKQLERPGECCYEALTEAFGDTILQQGYGSPIDNPKLAARIYSDKTALETVNGIVHPSVWRYVSEYIESARLRNESAAAGITENESMPKSDEGGCSEAADGRKTRKSEGEAAVNDVRIAVETALPNETFTELCDEIWYIYTDEEVRIARLMADRGYSREKSLSVIAKQLSVADFKKYADRLIDNSGERAKTEEEVRKRLDEIFKSGKREQR